MTPQEKDMFAGWVFKGIEIKPFAIATRNHAINIVAGMNPGPTMFAAVVYSAICHRKEIMRGLRDPEWFLEKVSDWITEIELGPDDYEALGTIFKELVENSESNRARPVSDPSLMPDPDALGNA